MSLIALSVWLSIVAAAHAVTDDEFEQKLLTVIGIEESQLDPDVATCKRTGDQGRSRGTFQVMARTAEEYRLLCRSVEDAARIALQRLRESLAVCKAYPEADRLSVYNSGSCTNAAGIRISRQRWKKAKEMVESVPSD